MTIPKGKSTAHTITDYAHEEAVDHMVIGCDGMRAFTQKRTFLGSVTDACVKHAKCNVVVAQTFDMAALERSRSVEN